MKTGRDSKRKRKRKGEKTELKRKKWEEQPEVTTVFFTSGTEEEEAHNL